jgi:ribonuclease VapC
VIVVDTSALITIVFEESLAEECRKALEETADVRISAGTLSVTLIVATGRNIVDEMILLVDGLQLSVEPVDAASAKGVARAFADWGKGIHPAGLNFGDCFAYALARELDCPLLFVGKDFAKTDVKPALS